MDNNALTALVSSLPSGHSVRNPTVPNHADNRDGVNVGAGSRPENRTAGVMIIMDTVLLRWDGQRRRLSPVVDI